MRCWTAGCDEAVLALGEGGGPRGMAEVVANGSWRSGYLVDARGRWGSRAGTRRETNRKERKMEMGSRGQEVVALVEEMRSRDRSS